MEKINIAEILKDCPKGMELDCTIIDGLYFGEVTENMIKCYTKQYHESTCICNTIEFNHDGTYLTTPNAKCVIFPKGKTTWEGFQKPFKDGDIVATLKGNQIFIFKENVVNINGSFSGVCYFGYDIRDNQLFKEMRYSFSRHATEEEKQKLFDTIKDNGYKWNPETKSLEKLMVPKFKVGDVIQDKDGYKVKITDVSVEDECYGYESTIVNGIGGIAFNRQDDWKLVPNKFDITTLKPFDKVLVRDNNTRKWTADLFSFFDKRLVYPYSCVGHYTNQCIPYGENKHLLGTTNDCDDYYKTWE